MDYYSGYINQLIEQLESDRSRRRDWHFIL